MDRFRHPIPLLDLRGRVGQGFDRLVLLFLFLFLFLRILARVISSPRPFRLEVREPICGGVWQARG